MVTSIVAVGVIRIVRPADPDRLLDEPAVLDWNRRDDYMPYWAYLWPGAYLLAETVMREPGLTVEYRRDSLKRSRSAAGWVWRAWLLWHEAALLFHRLRPGAARLRRAKRGRERLRPDSLRRSPARLARPPGEQFPVILGADVIYEAPWFRWWRIYSPSCLRPAAWALIATPYRVAAEASRSRSRPRVSHARPSSYRAGPTMAA